MAWARTPYRSQAAVHITRFVALSRVILTKVSLLCCGRARLEPLRVAVLLLGLVGEGLARRLLGALRGHRISGRAEREPEQTARTSAQQAA